MSEYIITIEQIKDLVTQSATEAIGGYKSGVVKQIWQYPLLPKIVRCRDCVHMHTVRSWLGTDVDECWLHADPETGALGKNRTEPDGFCAWGERRSE